MICLTSARFSMKATLLHQGQASDESGGTTGHWENGQDPVTGEIINIWVEDNPDTPTDESGGGSAEQIKCTAKSVVSNAVRSASAMQQFGEMYVDKEYVQITFGADVVMSNSDRITNVLDSKGKLVYRDYQFDNQPATIFNVLGVIPVFDPFNRHIENFALLERAE